MLRWRRILSCDGVDDIGERVVVGPPRRQFDMLNACGRNV